MFANGDARFDSPLYGREIIVQIAGELKQLREETVTESRFITASIEQA
jgi:hypothetical protein